MPDLPDNHASPMRDLPKLLCPIMHTAYYLTTLRNSASPKSADGGPVRPFRPIFFLHLIDAAKKKAASIKCEGTAVTAVTALAVTAVTAVTAVIGPGGHTTFPPPRNGRKIARMAPIWTIF